MKVDVTKKNPSLESLFNDPGQVITLDASFLIPPDRSHLSGRNISFSKFQDFWLNPIFSTFPKLAIHEAVQDEFVSRDIKAFIQEKASATPPRIIIHKDSELSNVEMMLRNSIEDKIFPLTQYDPQVNNRNDRGEVKTLSYIAVKGFLYFAAHDYNALQLVEMAESWSTGLDAVQTIEMYEIIFYLCVKIPSLRKSLRMLYKYLYHLTKNEKRTNPEWGIFIESMESLYQSNL